MPLETLQNGRYRILRTLGSGSMGEVYLVEDRRINRQVAIKVIRIEAAPYPDSDTTTDLVRLFEREAKAIARLNHPNILPLFDFGEEVVNETPLTYMVMPYSPEGSLASWLQQRGPSQPLSTSDVAHFLAQAADALQHAERGSLPGAAHDLPDRVREDEGAQALPEVADRHPVEGQDREVQVIEPHLRGAARDGEGHRLGRSAGPKWPTPGMWSPIRMTQRARREVWSWGRKMSE